MKNGSAAFRSLENAVKQADTAVRTEAPGSYVSMAVYAPSTHDPDAVFALFHTSQTPVDARRADQYIYRRLLDPAHSIAAEAHTHGAALADKSRMFPDEHFCMHWPIGQGREQGVLQLVFNKSAQRPSVNDVADFIRKSTPLNLLGQRYSGLVTQATDLDKAFNARAAYTPNGIVLACDISGHTHISSALGQFRAQDFINEFCTQFITDIAEKYDAEILRFEGDGVWMLFPIDAQRSFADAELRAQAAAADITQGFMPFVKETEPGFEQAHIRVARELGEVAIYTNDDHDSKLGTGPIFTYTSEALKQADRTNDVILIGPNLAKEKSLPTGKDPLAFRSFQPKP